MHHDIPTCYQRYTLRAAATLVRQVLCARGRAGKLSAMNRLRDYLRLGNDGALLALHHRMNTLLLEAAGGWDSYDYGGGYFYQSLADIGVSGLRHTHRRVSSMNLLTLTKDCSVLDIGCNCGFVSLSVATVARRVVGFDVNPYLIEIARLVAAHLQRGNARFEVSAFESWPCAEQFDVVLSLANHATYDGNTAQPIEAYFRRCRALLHPGGVLVFESHPPAHEGERLDVVRELLGELFDVHEQRVLNHGSFLDRGRTLIIAHRPTEHPESTATNSVQTLLPSPTL